MGRHSSLEHIDYKQLEKLAGFGLTDREIGSFYGVSEQTINSRKIKDRKFLESLRFGKIKADTRVIESLFKRATGYEHRETMVFCNKGSIVTHEVIKHYPPEATSMIFWLKNRMGGSWKDKQDIDLGIQDDTWAKFEKLSISEIKEQIARLVGGPTKRSPALIEASASAEEG